MRKQTRGDRNVFSPDAGPPPLGSRKCVRNLPQTAQFPVKKFVTTFTMDFDKF